MTATTKQTQHAPPSPQEMLKMMYLRLAEIAFHGISAVKIKCHLTLYLTMFQKFYEFNESSIFYKTREYFPSMHVSVRMGRSVSSTMFSDTQVGAKFSSTNQYIYGLLIHKYSNYSCIRKNVD